MDRYLDLNLNLPKLSMSTLVYSDMASTLINNTSRLSLCMASQSLFDGPDPLRVSDEVLDNTFERLLFFPQSITSLKPILQH